MPNRRILHIFYSAILSAATDQLVASLSLESLVVGSTPRIRTSVQYVEIILSFAFVLRRFGVLFHPHSLLGARDHCFDTTPGIWHESLFTQMHLGHVHF
jgi:hypothetical protein